MNKFNKAQFNLQKEKRAKRSQAKRLKSGSDSLKVSRSVQSRPPSGKKIRKLQRKLRQAQKDAIETGLVTMEDIEMIAAENSEPDSTATAKPTSTKPASGFKVKKLKHKKHAKNAGAKNQPVKSSGVQPMEE